MNFAAKEAIARVRIQPTEWEEIFAGYPSERKNLLENQIIQSEIDK